MEPERKKNILFSVIVIGYNIEKYIEQCLQSILGQTYTNFEILFVNDGSTDRTYNIAVEVLKDCGICLSKENGGIISARKYGVENSTGKYIVFVDGDDYINSDMLYNYAVYLENCLEIPDILCTDHWAQQQNGEFIRERSKIQYGKLRKEEYSFEILHDSLQHYMFSKIYRREFLIQAGYLSFPNITMAEDLYSNACLGLHHPLVLYLDNVNYYYRYNFSSATKNGNIGILRQIKTLELLENYYISNGVYKKYKSLIDYQWYLFAYTYTFPFPSGFNVKKELFKKCRLKLKGHKKNVYVTERYKTQHIWINGIFDLYCLNTSFGAFVDRCYLLVKKICKRV